MIQKLKLQLARFLARDYIDGVDSRANQRVAEIVLALDPFEQITKKFRGSFSKNFERVEDELSEPGKIQMFMWGYQQANDPSFKRMVDWIANSAGNQMVRAPVRSIAEGGEVLIYGKAQIASMLLLAKEIQRLSSQYEEMMRKKEDFNSETTVE